MSLQHCVLWAVEFARLWQPEEASGVDLNVLLWLLFSFMLGLRRGWGENFLLLNVSETATHVTGRYVSQYMPNAHWCLLEPCAWNLL